MKQQHTWMEYQYRFVGSNDNNKMWIRDNQRIHQASNGAYCCVVNDKWSNFEYNSFDETLKEIESNQN